MSEPHFLIVTFPAQGHINPALQFAKRLMRIGVRVTLSTTIYAKRRMTHSSFPEGLSLAPFSDGYDDGLKPGDDRDNYMAEFERRGSQSLSDLIEGNSFTCLIYTLLLPWAAKVARAQHIPSSLLWIQPATVLDIYYYYFNGYGDMFRNCSDNDSSYVVKLPGGIPPLSSRDLPSFLAPGNPYSSVISIFEEQLKVINEEENPKVLVNSFDALESEALKGIESIKMIGIGPLVPSGKDLSCGGDLFESSKDYIEWLNSKEDASVVYVSFGSIAMLSNEQMEEIGKCLLKSKYEFLWVIRKDQKEKLSCTSELESESESESGSEKKRKIVEWCSQLQVLSHPALGCFVTHCGWNSTLESIVLGVPVVAFPQWTDQGTNAKLIEDQWETGVRVVPNERGIVECEEIMRCLDLIMGECGNNFRNNAIKWKDLAGDALMDNGSSEINLRTFVNGIVSLN
ncbi:phloretin 4'-O-glucosyltransferase [Euphorbia lathyris]|uniref:phloretin 4'-O-glucosyltransferase n=1 Tax=Euphorbia lathyris TaxID=212925 RepID=UPI003314105F